MKSRQTPLSVLVSQVLVPLVWELDDASIDASLVVWADLLRVVPEGGALQNELLSLAHVSPRSMNVLVSAAVGLGLVVTEKAPKGGPFVRLTALGADACRLWEVRLFDVEHRWRSDHATDDLGSSLERVVGGIGTALPWLLLPYGPADNSASIGPPVPRVAPPVELPLLALLSQLLAALTLAYEARHGWMLSMMATSLGGFPDDGLPVAEVAPFAGVKGNGKTLHERHGIVTVEDKIVRLTEKGRRLRDNHQPMIDAVERDWAAQDGPEDLAAVRSALGLVAAGLPSEHVRHLCMEYRKGGRAFVEVSPRG